MSDKLIQIPCPCCKQYFSISLEYKQAQNKQKRKPLCQTCTIRPIYEPIPRLGQAHYTH